MYGLVRRRGLEPLCLAALAPQATNECIKYTTLIVVPATEKIMEAATGDKDFWIVDVVGNFCFVHPAKPGISSNLNLITDKGNRGRQAEGGTGRSTGSCYRLASEWVNRYLAAHGLTI